MTNLLDEECDDFTVPGESRGRVNYQKAPLPYFGGKRGAAPTVWSLIGDVPHYVEPFAGSLAVLLERPHPCNRAYYSETVGDADGLMVNMWRSIQWHPEETAEHASWPVSECVPAGTMIATPTGEVPIEALTAGMTVLGHNGVEVVETTVEAAWGHVSERPFVRIGELALTDNHPVWTAEHGYIQAGKLTADSHVAIINKQGRSLACCGEDDGTEAVRLLRRDVSEECEVLAFAMGEHAVLLQAMRSKRADAASEGLREVPEGVSANIPGSKSLFMGVQERIAAVSGKALCYLRRYVPCKTWKREAALLFDNVRDEKIGGGAKGETAGSGVGGSQRAWGARQAARVSALPQQPNPKTGGPRKGSCDFAREWLQATQAWLESASYSAATNSCRPVAVGYGVCGQNELPFRPFKIARGASRVSSSQVLPRHSGTEPEDQHRDRRTITQLKVASGIGCQKGREATHARVDGHSIHQHQGVDGLGGGAFGSTGGCQVYNIQTGTGNYFAAGILVHNCDKQARQIACLRWINEERNAELLAGSAEWCDPKMAGWWLYGVACHIGSVRGPWTCDPATGRITKIKDVEGVSRGLPHLSCDGRGVNRPQLREGGVGDEPEFHPVTMPELRRWFRWLSARLRHVRIVSGDWRRLCTSGVMFTIPVRSGKGPCGVFLDPPYDNAERADECYRHDDGQEATAAREWCKKWGDDPRCRIVLAGYDTEHTELEQHGWTVHEWFRAGFLKGGMGNIDGTSQQKRERLWASPHCLREAPVKVVSTPSLFGEDWE